MRTWAEHVATAEVKAKCGHAGGCGCELYDGCCEGCPLPAQACDSPRDYVTYLRDAQIRELKQGGMPVWNIADRFSMSERNAFRILSGGDI